MFLKVLKSVLKLVMIKNVKFRPLNKSFTSISPSPKKILHRFVLFCISVIFKYCLFVKKKLMTIKHFFLNFFWEVKMCDKMAISAYILKIVENDPFSRLQMSAKEMFNRHQFFFTHKR